MIRDYVHLSFVSLKNRGLRSWLTIIGIFIGIAAVVTLISLGQGLRSVVAGQFNFLSTDILSVQASGTGQGPPGEGVVKPLQEDYIDDLEGVNGVGFAIGRIIENTAMEFNGYVDFTFAGSMPDGEKRREIKRIAQLELDKGRMLEDHDTARVVLGSNYGTDDEFGRAVRLRDEVIIHDKRFEVVGLLKKKGSFIVDNIILMNEPVMKELFEVNNTYDIILAKVSEGHNMGRVKERIEDFLRDERQVEEGEEDFSVESPEQELKSLDATLFAIQIFIYVIAGISLLVGGIGIANTMFTSVVERTRQIGIMKSIGARRSTIFLLFFIESGLLGAVGGLLGIFFGIGVAHLISFLGGALLDTDLLQASVPLSLAVGAFFFSFVIGSISGILPALRAASLHPVEALRKLS